MADRVYPAAKPAANGGGANPTFPPTKAQLYNTNRPVYRPHPPPKRRSRSCCCSLCLWIILFLILIILFAAIAGVVLWVIYRPHRPNFTVSSLQLSQFNLTSTHLNSKFNFTLTARNPNKKISFIYDPINVAIYSDAVDIGDGSFPGFVHGTENSTTLKTVIASSGQSLDSSTVSTLKSDLKKQNGLSLKIQLDTKVKVKIGSLKTKRVGIRVTCDGIKLAVPTGKAATVTASNIKCKVDLRIKIWKWTV